MIAVREGLLSCSVLEIGRKSHFTLHLRTAVAQRLPGVTPPPRPLLKMLRRGASIEYTVRASPGPTYALDPPCGGDALDRVTEVVTRRPFLNDRARPI